MNEAIINFFNADIEFELSQEKSIATKLIEYIKNSHNDCGTINYIFCSDDYLLELNVQYLQHDYYTDILSFQMNDDPVEGDIFISIDRVKDNASQMNLEFENELLRVISHGILHFLGYKDKTPDQQKEMRTKEDELITILKN
jgi:rRNA maturation RNase YbeY